MANDGRKDKQEPPSSTSALQRHDHGFPILRSEPANSTGCFNAAGANNMRNPSTTRPLSPFAFGSMQATPKSYSEGNPSTGFELMANTSHSQTPQNTRSVQEYFRAKDIQLQLGPYSNSTRQEGNITTDHSFHATNSPVATDNVINPASYANIFQNPPTSNQFVNDNSASSSRRIEQGEVTIGNHRFPQTVGSFFNYGGQTLFSDSALDGEEIEMSNNLMPSAVQSLSPQKRDGILLRLGIEDPEEALSRCSISGRDITSDNNQMAAFPRSNTFDAQSAVNFLNPSIDMAGDFSVFRNNGDCFSWRQQHVDNWTFPNSTQHVLSDVNAELLSNSNSIAQTPQHDERHHFFIPSDSVTPGIVGSHDAGFAGIDSDNYCEDYSTILPIPGSSQVVPNSRQSRATGLLPSTPGFSSKTSTQPSSSNDQRFRLGVTPELLSNSRFVVQTLQHDEGHHFPMSSNRINLQIVGNQDEQLASSVSNNDFQDNSILSPIPGRNQVVVHNSRRSRATSDSSWRTSEPSMFIPLNTVTRSNSLQNQFGEPFAANEGGGATQVSERGQQIPITSVNRIPQAGQISYGPALKRSPTDSSQAAAQSQRRRTRMPSTDLSISTRAQSDSPIRNLPEVASSAGLARTSLSLSHQSNRTSLQPQHQTAQMHHLIPQVASSIPPQPGASLLPHQFRFIPFPPYMVIAPAFPPQLLPAQPFPLPPRHVQTVPFHPGPRAIIPPFQPQYAPTLPLQPGIAPTFPFQPRSTSPLQPWNLPHPQPRSRRARGRPPRLRGTPRQRHPPTNAIRHQFPLTNEVFHIKWEDPEMKPQLLGHNCFICKRDLSFTEEGPVSIPSRAPPAAVLPCGHTFHDSCLERITPQCEATKPTCIACAIGETSSTR